MQKLYSKILLVKIITITALQLNIASAQLDGSVYGFVTDSSNGEALIGANVFINELGLGMATDINGYYVLQGITPGIHDILVSYVGYEILSERIEIVDGDALKLDLVLKEEVVSIGQIEVTAEKLKRKNNIQPSTVNLSPRMLRSAPALAEPDLFRTIQALPGVLTTSEFSTGLVIRGGNTDQNLILLDGVTVYNPSHLGGIFSNFIVDGVKEAELIKGAYNAEYGGRLSPVLNIISREGNKKKIEGKANLSLLSAQATLEGPFYKGAWVFSGRRTYFDKIFQNVPSIPPYYFYDIQSHIYSDLTSKDRISLSFYNGVDDLIFDTFGLAGRWGNRTISTQYRRVFSEKLIGNFLLANSLFFTEFGLGGSNGLNSDNEIDDATLAANFSWFKSSSSVVKFGAQIKNLGFLYTNSFNDSLQFKIKTKPKEYAGYAKLKYSPSEKFILEPGVRINLLSLIHI